MKDVPEVDEKLLEGTLSLMTANQLQNFFSAEKNDQKLTGAADKLELIASYENKSAVEVQKELVSLRPEIEERESTRSI